MVLVLGGVTAVLGVLYALMQHDLKRLLAYHTVENIGIIFIGLGLALAFQANGMAGAAALALTAALFHVLNHSLFKSLLFFGSGAVLTATGERDMEHLGGLIHRMPLTAFAFLVGCVAISALPPLNGFVSEWLTFQAILLSPNLPQWGLKLLVPAVGAMLALSAALAAACFVKAFGITFLGRPRTPAAASGRDEVDRWSLAAMFAFAGLCLLAGMLPGLVIDGLAPVVTALTGGAHAGADRPSPGSSIVPIGEGRSSYNGLLVFLFIAVSASPHRLRRSIASPRARCAARRPGTAAFPIRARSPSTPPAASPSRSAACSARSSSARARRSTCRRPAICGRRAFEVALRDLVWEALYAPIAGAVGFAADRLNTCSS